MSTNTPADGTRPGSRPSDAAALFRPGAATPPGPSRELSGGRDLPGDRDLPELHGPKPIPDPPLLPSRLDRMERVPFPPVPRAPAARMAAGMGDRRHSEPRYGAGPHLDARVAPPPPSRKARLNELEPEPDDGDLFPAGRHGRGQQPEALPYYGIPEPDEGTKSVPSFFEAVVSASRMPPPPEPEVVRKRSRIQWPTLVVLPLLIGAVVGLFYLQPTPWQAELLQATPPEPNAGEATPPVAEPAQAAASAPEQAPEAPSPAVAQVAVPDAPAPAPALTPAPPPVAAAPDLAAPPSSIAPRSAPPTAVAAAPTAASAPPARIGPEPYGPPVAKYSSIVIRARANNPAERAEMGRVAALLQPMAGRIELLVVQNTFRFSTVRYFYPEDAEAAQTLADDLARIGEPWRVMSATPQRPTPQGRLEVWVVEQ